ERLVGGLGGPGPFILPVGTLEPRKNIERLVDAFLSLDVRHRLVVVGATGWLTEPLLAKLAHPRIVRPSDVSDEQLVALYNLADVFVYPSLYEGFGLPALAALSWRTPVAVST